MPIKYWIILAVPMVAMLCLAQNRTDSDGLRNKPEAVIQALLKSGAGSAALDCGAVSVQSRGTNISDCVINAFRQRKPFYAIYYLRGIDSIVGRALAQDSQGRVFETSFDVALSMEPNPHNRIETSQCTPPVQLLISRSGRLSCANGRFSGDAGICLPAALSTPVTSSTGGKGSVEAEVLVERDGKVSILEVLRSDLERNAEEAFYADTRNWRFSPALKDGTPVTVRTAIIVAIDGAAAKVSVPTTEPKCFDSVAVIGRN